VEYHPLVELSLLDVRTHVKTFSDLSSNCVVEFAALCLEQLPLGAQPVRLLELTPSPSSSLVALSLDLSTVSPSLISESDHDISFVIRAGELRALYAHSSIVELVSYLQTCISMDRLFRAGSIAFDDYLKLQLSSPRVIFIADIALCDVKLPRAHNTDNRADWI